MFGNFACVAPPPGNKGRGHLVPLLIVYELYELQDRCFQFGRRLRSQRRHFSGIELRVRDARDFPPIVSLEQRVVIGPTTTLHTVDVRRVAGPDGSEPVIDPDLRTGLSARTTPVVAPAAKTLASISSRWGAKSLSVKWKIFCGRVITAYDSGRMYLYMLANGGFVLDMDAR